MLSLAMGKLDESAVDEFTVVREAHELAKTVRARQTVRQKHQEYRRLRLRLGLSQERIAASLGISGANISFWELGKYTPTGKQAMRYVQLMELLKKEEL